MQPDFLKLRTHRTVWLWSGLATVVFTIWFALTVEWPLVVAAIEETGSAVLLAAFLLLIVNGLLAVLWMIVVSQRPHQIGPAFKVIAWQMLASTILPARLSDLAWMYFIHRWLGIRAGRAVFIALFHRLLDFVTMSFFFLVALLVVGVDLVGENIALAAGVLFAAFAAIVVSLEFSLTMSAIALRYLGRRFDHRLLRPVLRQLLHVRIWYRHGLPRTLLWLAFVIIILRWLAIIVGLVLLIRAMAVPLSWTDSLFATNVYIYFGIVPIQAIGGFGFGEAGLAWVLTLYGLSLAKASTISLLIRVMINVVHALFWLVTILAMLIIGRPR